jgi:FlaA1/EpsC-like NDP-sugar epimerase
MAGSGRRLAAVSGVEGCHVLLSSERWEGVIRFQDLPSVDDLARRLVPRLIDLGRYQKRTILAIADVISLGLALWLSMSLRLGELYVAPTWPLTLIFCAAPVIGVGTFFRFGLYRLVTRFIGGDGAALILVAVCLSALIWSLLVLLSGVTGVPRSVVVTYPILAAAFVWATRQAAGWLLKRAGIEPLSMVRENAMRVLIYGAGTTGVQLLQALRHAPNYVAVGFVDASPAIWGQYVSGLKVMRPDRLPSVIQHHDVKEVLLALPKARRRERQVALRQLEALGVAVRTLPAMEDLAAGRVTVSDLRPVEAEDLLGRDPVPPNGELMARNITAKSVLVTGAGGSIGSELVRQILRHGPRRLVLLDSGEAQLYQIELEAGEILQGGRFAQSGPVGVPEVAAVLGSVQNRALMLQTLERHAIQTVYHAAAYKHVPLVEHNVAVGLQNNTFGTAVVAEAAQACGVERFVLVSTDKAVRPTSVMGASKRLAEMILQARAAGGEGRTVFSIVRFGNVLDSSGSVVRRFRRQIEAGGPVTVTHPDAIRYFMSIPEAAALVIQAGAMATGGDVFVLDMGEPVKIDSLARSMIRLMGREVRDAQSPDGDVAIEYIGLRRGEKLHEELLLGENVSATEHPRISRSREPWLPAPKLAKLLDELGAALARDDVEAVQGVLMRAVEGYRPELRHAPPQAPVRIETGTAHSAVAT